MIITIKQNNKSSNLHYVRKGRTQNVRLEEAKREIDGRKKKSDKASQFASSISSTTYSTRVLH